MWYLLARRGRNFYGEGGAYSMFAGRDASRALAKMSFDQEHLDNPSTEDLSPGKLAGCATWSHFSAHSAHHFAPSHAVEQQQLNDMIQT